MRELDVVGVRVEMPSNNPIVLLKERDGERFLPIWIGAPEASAIAFAQQGLVPQRPLTHDLIKDLLAAVGRRLVEVRIVAVHENVYHAELVLDQGTTISARSSDAIALALRVRCPILGAEDVLAASGVAVPEEDEDEVERFREFLDQVSAEDFEAPNDDPSDDTAQDIGQDTPRDTPRGPGATAGPDGGDGSAGGPGSSAGDPGDGGPDAPGSTGGPAR